MSDVREPAVRGTPAARGRSRPCLERVAVLHAGGVARSRIAIVLVAATVFACEGGGPPAARVVRVTERGVIARTDTIQGRDGGPSGLAFGRSVWTFGDTVLEVPDGRGERWHTNSYALLAPGASVLDGLEDPIGPDGVPPYFIAHTADELAWDALHAPEACTVPPCHVRWAIWPGRPLYDEASGRAWIFYGLYNDVLPSGIGVAVWSGLDQPVQRRRVGESWLLFPKPEPEYANAPVVHEGYVYAFGCVPNAFARPCTLGRVPVDEVDQRAAWAFFDGAGWVPDYREARVLFDGQPIMSLGYREDLGAWLLVYSPPFDAVVLARTAPALTGPWSAELELFQIDGESPYDAVHHPELREGAVEMISYSRPTGRGWFGAEHVLVEVELAPE